VNSNYGSGSLLKGLDSKPQVGFVNETVEIVETVLSTRIEHSVSKDESGLKRKRGKPKKDCTKLSTTPSTFHKDEPCWRRERGRLKKFCRIASISPPPTIPKDQPGKGR
jgi:hypothetical protein